MSAQALRITTLLVTGVAIGVTFGAICLGTLPAALGAAVILVVSIAGVMGSK